MSSASESSSGPAGSDGSSRRPGAPGQATDSLPLSPLQQRLADAHSRHFRRNMRLTLVLLVFWAAAGLGCGVLFADALNQYQFLGFPLGFWFAQQGSIFTFVLLILIYALAMGRLDRRLAEEVLAIHAAEGNS